MLAVDDEEDESEMEVVVRAMTGHEWRLRVRPTQCLDSLRSTLWRISGVAPEHQGLSLSGIALTSGVRTLADYGIRPNCSLQLNLLARSGPLLHQSAHADRPTKQSTHPRSVSIPLLELSRYSETRIIAVILVTNSTSNIEQRVNI